MSTESDYTSGSHSNKGHIHSVNTEDEHIIYIWE